MMTKQKQTLDAFVRVLAFADAHPLTGPLGYTTARGTLEEVVRRLREYAAAQVTGQELSRGELRRQKQLARQLVVRHMRPIATIGRAQIEPESDVRMPTAIRMPRAGVGVTKLLQACDGMIEAARPFEAAFVAHGLPADFLAQLTSARNELEAGLSGRATQIGTHVGASAGLRVQFRRGRRAVDRLDAVVNASFDGDEVTLARWRTAKRVQQLTGGAAPRGTDEVPQAA
jgi:hypothetical protein